MALSANKDTEWKEGLLQIFPVEDNVHIYKGAMVCANAAGYATPAVDTASHTFLGEAYEECDNTLTGHSQGGKSVRVRRTGVMKVAGSAFTQAMVGARMYVVDDETVHNTSANLVPAGILVKYVSGTVGWIDMAPGVRQACSRTEIISVPAHARSLEASGWVNGDAGLTFATNQSDKDCYVPIPGLKVGDIITKIHVHGGIGATTDMATVLDVSLYKVVGLAGGSTPSVIQAMDQVSSVVDYLVDEEKALATPETIAAGEHFYFMITGTTANDALCDIIVTGLEVEVTRTYPD